MAAKKTLAQLIRDREADTEQAALRGRFLANPPRVWLEAQRIFGPLKIETIRKCGITEAERRGR